MVHLIIVLALQILHVGQHWYELFIWQALSCGGDVQRITLLDIEIVHFFIYKCGHLLEVSSCNSPVRLIE